MFEEGDIVQYTPTYARWFGANDKPKLVVISSDYELTNTDKGCFITENLEIADENLRKVRQEQLAKQWKVQIKGGRDSKNWEISVVRLDNLHGQRSWGWFDNTKLLVSRNGDSCS